MSEVESYIGTLTPVDMGGKTLDEWIINKLEINELGYYDNWLEALDDKYWKEFHFDENSQILYAVEKQEFDPDNMGDVYRNDDGTYGFVVSFYNGGTYFGEVIQKGLDKVKEQEIKKGIGVHYLLFNGYEVGDRLLEGVYFKVSLKVEGMNAEIIDIIPDESAYPYIENIRWENYVEAIRKNVQFNIDHLKNFYKDDNTTFEKEFEKFQEEIGENGVQLIMEV